VCLRSRSRTYEDNLIGVENVAEGEAALSFKAGVVYDNFSSDQDFLMEPLIFSWTAATLSP
jgi:hypothetical protein